MSVVILDLGYGNVRSVALGFERIGVEARRCDDAAVAAAADRLVIPGVGAAASAMTLLRQHRLDDRLRARVKPTLGICLGMQLLFAHSDEDGGTALLGLLPGRVRALRPAPGAPVPHMGWSRIAVTGADCGLMEGDYLAFAHSYACPDSAATVAVARHGATTIPVAVRHGPWWGAQFHPERSSSAGARFLKAFCAA